MSATLIQSAASGTPSVTSTLVFTDVQVGDLIVVAGCSFNGPSAASCSDSVGSTYQGPFRTQAGGFGFIAGFCAFAQTAGTITVTIDGPGPTNVGIGATYRNAGGFDQAAGFVGQYIPVNPAYPLGVATGPFTIADTLVVSVVYDTTGGGGAIASDSGDNIVLVNGGMNLFEKFATGPGSSSSAFKTPLSALTNQLPVLAMTFSAPLARPSGTTEQYALRGGQGFADETTTINQNKNPLLASLPYTPSLGSLVVVAASYANCGVAGSSLSVADDYGNIYTQAVVSPGNDLDIVLFYTVLTALPPTGQVFRARITASDTSCGGIIYQTTNIAIAEKQITSILGVAAAAWSSDAVAPPNLTLKSAVLAGVPASTYLFGFAAYASGLNQTGVNWSALEGYTLQQQQSFIQFPFAITNLVRVGTSAILTKFTTVSGNYDVQAVADIIGNFAEAGSIALLAVTLSIPVFIACPAGGGSAKLGVFYDEFLQVSGGVAPYTFAIISGALPPGLNLNPATGEISGTPIQIGTFNYVAQVTDANGNTAHT